MTIPKMTPTAPPAPPTASPSRKVAFGKIQSIVGHRILLYGPGGIGKTTVSTMAPGPVAFFDLDESLPRLAGQLETPPAPVDVSNWQDIRTALQSDGWDGIKTIVIDSITRAEELAIVATLATVKTEKGNSAKNVEDYGYGKGYGFVFDTFLPLLGDLDRHCRAGRNVILIAHDCTTNVPNPSGEDWLRYEPRLQSPASGKASIRLRVREWADHVLFLGYDVAVDSAGKGKGSGTRTLWPSELPFCMAKSRTTQAPIAIDANTNLWAEIIK
jgi:hypothetical protein